MPRFELGLQPRQGLTKDFFLKPKCVLDRATLQGLKELKIKSIYKIIVHFSSSECRKVGGDLKILEVQSFSLQDLR